MAQQFGVGSDGTVVLTLDEDRTQRYTLPTSLGDARMRLRSLDETVQQMLMRLARGRRTVYLTVGHGELNDSTSADPMQRAAYGGTDALFALFGMLNYQVSDLGVQNGLGRAVPDDAALVVVLGPRRPFLEPELEALDRYLAGGGSALFALEPETGFRLGPLEQRLGVKFHDEPLADDVEHLQQRGNLSDRRLIVTDRFSSHEALATLGQTGVGAGIALFGAGYFSNDVPGSRATAVVRSLDSTFPDSNGDFEQEEATEKRASYGLVVAVEGDSVPAPAATADSAPVTAPAATAGTAPATAPAAAARTTATTATAGAGARAMRAMMFADADMFSDQVVTSLGLNAALVADAVRWLGHEEQLSGEVRSEKDVPIVHTQAEDVAWFYAIIFGMPALVLLAGLLGVRRRRRASAPGREA